MASIKIIGPNMIELRASDDVTVLFSYETPVAAHVAGIGYLVTDTHYSQTTTKHIKRWLGGAKFATVQQDTIDALVAR